MADMPETEINKTYKLNKIYIFLSININLELEVTCFVLLHERKLKNMFFLFDNLKSFSMILVEKYFNK